jgi:pimeloyl-ACP methyl ester carboxylesterase
MTIEQSATPPAGAGAASKEGPLAPFAGTRPPAPAWFAHAIARAPERAVIPVGGVGIEALAWGERGKPGLMLMHGNTAHADWWSFIAPFFADRFRVAAISWSGMGGSGWRAAYSSELFADEALVAGEALGLFDAAVKPIYLAHSFGGQGLRRLAIRDGARLAGAILLDSRTDMMGRPPRADEKSPFAGRGPPIRTRPNNVYPTFEAALARFRLAPPQPCENLYLVDYIARHSLKRAPMEDGSGEGWTWRFDPFLFRNLAAPDEKAMAMPALCPMAMIWGARSELMQFDRVAMIRAMQGGPMVEIPDSGHHVMLDQPLALVSALAALLECWPPR